jgi:hypothetical protein
MDVNDDREEYDMEFRPVLLGSSAVKPPSENRPKPPPSTPVLKKTLSLPPPPQPPNSPNHSEEDSEEEADHFENYSILVDQMRYLQQKVDNLQSELAVFRSRQQIRNFGLVAFVLAVVYVM